MNKILCTGISGFLGHHLIKAAYEKGYEIVGVDKRPIPPGHDVPDHFIQTDVRDLNFRDLLGIDGIVHLAFSTNIPNSVRHPKETTVDNIDMTIHLLEVAKEAGIKRFVFPSTASLYSNNPTPWKEDMPAQPIEPYSWQKLSLEYACQMYSRVYKLPTVILRFFQIFGELQRDDTALAAFLRAKDEGKPITLTETTAQSTFRSGQRDFVYAGDVAKAIILALESEKVGRGEVINIASGEFHTMEDVANAIGADVVFIPKRDYEVERHHADVSLARSLLGFRAEVDVIEWLKSINDADTV